MTITNEEAYQWINNNISDYNYVLNTPEWQHDRIFGLQGVYPIFAALFIETQKEFYQSSKDYSKACNDLIDKKSHIVFEYYLKKLSLEELRYTIYSYVYRTDEVLSMSKKGLITISLIIFNEVKDVVPKPQNKVPYLKHDDIGSYLPSHFADSLPHHFPVSWVPEDVLLEAVKNKIKSGRQLTAEIRKFISNKVAVSLLNKIKVHEEYSNSLTIKISDEEILRLRINTLNNSKTYEI